MRVIIKALTRLNKNNGSCFCMRGLGQNFILKRTQFLFFCFVVFALTLSNFTFAEPNRVTPKIEQNYNIPAGLLEDALNQFKQQSDIKLTFDPVIVRDVKTQGLSGSFDIQSGLKFLLIGSGLQAVEQDNGYAVIKSLVTNTMTVLPSIQVAASSIDRYNATTSVTATRTNTLLRDVPQAITVLTKELIRDQSILSLGDAVRYVPGVGVSLGEGNRDALIFRGNRSTGDFFIDGVRDDAPYFRDLYNTERMEVLKGANGMIFGRGGSGGVVNRVTKQADWVSRRQVSFLGGSFDRKRITADINQRITDKIAFRLNAVFEDSGSFRNSVNSRREGVSPTITFKPTDQTTVIFSTERFHDNRVADRGIPSFQGAPVNVARSQFFGDPARSHTNADVLSFSSFIEHKFDFGLTVRNRTNYAEYDKFYQNVFANSPVFSDLVSLGAYNHATSRKNVFNQTDFLYSLDTGPISHTLLAGIQVGQQITDDRRKTGFFNNSSRQINLFVPVSNPITQAPITFTMRNQDADNYSVVNVTSFLIQDQIEILPQLQAVVGVRYDRFDVDFTKRNGEAYHLETKNNLISPRTGLIFKPIEPVSIYATFSRAYVPRAGDQLSSLVVTTATLQPEKFTTLEAGLKWDISPHLAFTGAAYRLDRDNVISVDPNDSSKSFLTKGQRTKGVELSLSGQLTPSWSVMGGYAFQDGKITSTENAAAPKGATVPELPRNTFSMWSRYNFTPKFGAAFGVINRSDMFASTNNEVRVQGFTRVDAALFAQLSRQVRGQVNIENIFNTKYIASVHNNNNMLPGSPVAVRATLTINF